MDTSLLFDSGWPEREQLRLQGPNSNLPQMYQVSFDEVCVCNRTLLQEEAIRIEALWFGIFEYVPSHFHDVCHLSFIMGYG